MITKTIGHGPLGTFDVHWSDMETRQQVIDMIERQKKGASVTLTWDNAVMTAKREVWLEWARRW